MIAAAMTDVTTFRIPNWLTVAIAALFFPMAYLTGMPLVEFGWHLAAGAILFAIGFACFSFGLFGGGDAKLMAAAGLWFGTSQTLPFLLMTVVAGGALAVIVMGWSVFMGFWHHYGTGPDSKMDKQLKKVKLKMPYGLAFAVGALLVFPQTWWMNFS